MCGGGGFPPHHQARCVLGNWADVEEIHLLWDLHAEQRRPQRERERPEERGTSADQVPAVWISQLRPRAHWGRDEASCGAPSWFLTQRIREHNKWVCHAAVFWTDSLHNQSNGTVFCPPPIFIFNFFLAFSKFFHLIFPKNFHFFPSLKKRVI